MNIVERIYSLLEKSNIKAVDLSKATGVRQSTLTQWKRGLQKPSTEAVVKIAEYFNVTTDYLLGLSDMPARNGGLTKKETEVIQSECTTNLFGDRLAKTRMSRYLTIKQVSDSIGVSALTYEFYEKNSKEPDYPTLIKISQRLNASIDYLLGLSDVPAQSGMELSEKEAEVMQRYRDNPYMQLAVDKLLGVQEEGEIKKLAKGQTAPRFTDFEISKELGALTEQEVKSISKNNIKA